jgi:hypothetical protein
MVLHYCAFSSRNYRMCAETQNTASPRGKYFAHIHLELIEVALKPKALRSPAGIILRIFIKKQSDMRKFPLICKRLR